MPENYTVNSDVVLSADVKLKVKKIADAYFKATQKTIVVTSGTRSSSSQAEAMYGKLTGGDQLAVYGDQKSVKEIKKAYEDAKKAKKGKPEIIKAMQSVIDGQIKKGIYISRHLWVPSTSAPKICPLPKKQPSKRLPRVLPRW